MSKRTTNYSMCSFLPAFDCDYVVTIWSFCLDFSTTVYCNLKMKIKKPPFQIKLFLVRFFFNHNNRNEARTLILAITPLPVFSQVHISINSGEFPFHSGQTSPLNALFTILSNSPKLLSGQCWVQQDLCTSLWVSGQYKKHLHSQRINWTMPWH